MILEKQKETLELKDGTTQESFTTELDFDSADFLKQMLSKFYSDAIGSLIRETASNALDSHRETGCKEPILVSFIKKSDGNYEFSVEDFGVGVNRETIDNILRKYGKSTKRSSINQLGAFGLGWKSPLAYSSSFTFIGRKDGVETVCMMYEGEEDIKIDILHETPTTEKNGCKVIVPVKNQDRWNFRTKIKEQLAYFENVYFRTDDNEIANDFNIYRGKDFQYSELCTDNCLHICLDNVYYPIDFQKLGIGTIKVNIGLKFSLTDGLFPVPNRENIKYTVEAKEIIINKIKKVSDWFVNKYNESITDTENIFTVLSHFNDRRFKYVDINNDTPINISDLIVYSSQKKLNSPKIKNTQYLKSEEINELYDYFLKEYETEYCLQQNKISAEKYNKKVSINNFVSGPVYLFSDRMTQLKKEYIKFKHPNSTKIIFIKKKEPFKLWGDRPKLFMGSSEGLFGRLKLRNHPRKDWRAVIKEFLYIKDLITNPVMVDLDKMVIPKDFIESRKQKKEVQVKIRREKQVGEVTGKMCEKLEKNIYAKHCKLVPTSVDLSTLYKKPFTIVYGGEENANNLMNLYSLTKNSDKVKYLVLSERELKKIQQGDSHNLITIEKYMKGEHREFTRIATALLIEELRRNNREVFRESGLRFVSLDLYNKLNLLTDYNNLNYKGSGHQETAKAIIKIAEENNLFDPSIYDVYKEVKDILDKLPFLSELIHKITNYRSMQENYFGIQVLVDLFKYYKVKVNLNHYSVTVIEINEEQSLIEQLENA